MTLALVVFTCSLVAALTDPSTQPTTSQSKITAFQGEYRFLSNFYPATVEFEGITYPTVEHAYQSAKTLDMAERKRIAALATPSDAKREGRKLKLRDDWETAKFDVMERCVRYKFTHDASLREKLLATGDAILEEGNDWGDQVWGLVDGVGENRLGKILMKVRAELREG
jgi:N-glycosidase YbiA